MAKNSELLVIDGGTVKSEENGVVKGLAIVFGSPLDPDQSAQRDFFTESSFIMKKTSFEVPLYYNHGFPVKEQIGEAVLTKSEKGWEASGKLDLENELAKQVYENAKTKQFGFSTGALAHLVEREAKENNTNFLKRWVVGELSLTERPAERKAVVQAIKSIDGELVYETAFEEESKNMADEKETLVAVYDEEGNKIWDSETDEPMPEPKDAKSIEVKGLNGSVTYELYHYDEDTGKQTELIMYQWGGTEDFIQRMKEMLDTASKAVKDMTDDELSFEEKVKKIIKDSLPEKTESEEISELKAQLEESSDKLAQAEQTISDSEEKLTAANEKIAKLEILAGASKTINNVKGK